MPLTPRSVRNLLLAITAGFLVAHCVVQVGIYGFGAEKHWLDSLNICLLYTSPSPRDRSLSRMPSSA